MATMASLFCGAGGFDLAGRNAGIRTLWSSEVEPFCRLVEQKNFPESQQLGDIAKIDGGTAPPVDIITGGSPCQDMSVAGKREGLNGSRSCLFYEQIRVVKEARKAYGRPRYMVWENVPGAFISNGGRDFQSVLTETVRVAEPEAPDVPLPEEGWHYAGCLMAEDGRWSVAWRVLDAQYWGVPQRRKRIFLAADFGGGTAGEILFERQSVPRDAEKSRREKQASRSKAGSGAESTASVVDNHPIDARIKICEDNVVPTLATYMGTGGNNQPLVIARTGHAYETRICDDGVVPTIHTESKPMVVEVNPVKVKDQDPLKCPTLLAYKGYQPCIMGIQKPTIRRITPLECCRLQGFPDSWTEGLGIQEPTEEQIEYWSDLWATAGHQKSRANVIRWLKKPDSDSALYKMWGNSLAVPCAQFILEGIASEYKE